MVSNPTESPQISPAASVARPAREAEDQLRQVLAHIRLASRRSEVLTGAARGLILATGSSVTVLLLAGVLGPSSLARPLALAWLIGTGILLTTAVLIGYRVHRSDEDMARHIGARVPDLGSDLLSAVMLIDAEKRVDVAGISKGLVAELCRRVAAATATLSMADVVDRGSEWRLPIVAVLLIGIGLSRPGLLVQGLRNLWQISKEISVLGNEPLVGDIRLMLTPPKYTGLPQRTIPGSSGDVLALPGTQVRVEARVLLQAQKAQLVVTAGGSATYPAQLTMLRDDNVVSDPRGTTHPLLTASFTVRRPGVYHFVIDRLRSDRVRENDDHRIDIEQDRPPHVDLFAPAEDLEVGGTRRVELAYSAEDDHGLGDIDLVFQVGDTPPRRKRVRNASPAVSGAKLTPQHRAAAKIVWDLAELDLQAGMRLIYHLEARDLDDVSGPNVGRSRSYALRVVSPREKHDQLLARQEALQNLALSLLADRIDLSKEGSAEAPERVIEVHKTTESLLLLIGQLQGEADVGRAGPRDLRSTLQEVGRRIGKLSQEEEQLLGDWRNRRGATEGRRSRTGKSKEVAVLNEHHIVEMEKDVLLLADLLGRQHLEDLLALTDEMSTTRERLRQLFSEYMKSRSDSLKAEIEREIRQLERKLQELAEKAQEMIGEVPDEFLNSEAMGQNELQNRLDRLRDLLQKGEMSKAQEELDRLSQGLDNLMKGLESDLRGFRHERFTLEDKALSEIEDRMLDLLHDEEILQRETDTLREEASTRARQLLRDRTEQLSRRLQEQVARLRKQMADVEVGPLGPWGSDELDKTRKRVDDVGQMIEHGDLDEASAMAQEAEGSIERLLEEARAEESASRWGQRAQLSRARGRLEAARPMAHELTEEIARALPRNDELLPQEQKRMLQNLRSRQEAIRRRGEGLSREIGRRAREVRDAAMLERLSADLGDGLRKAGGYMEQAEGELRRMSPRSAAAAEGQAVEKLSQLRKQLQQARRPRNEGSTRGEREPIKIPGADEYRAPKEFRGDILDAAKRDAPAEFREQIKRYYEELVK